MKKIIFTLLLISSLTTIVSASEITQTKVTNSDTGAYCEISTITLSNIKLFSINELKDCFNNITYKVTGNKLIVKREVDKILIDGTTEINNTKLITVINVDTKKYITYIKKDKKVWTTKIKTISKDYIKLEGGVYYLSNRFLTQVIKTVITLANGEAAYTFNTPVKVTSVTDNSTEDTNIDEIGDKDSYSDTTKETNDASSNECTDELKAKNVSEKSGTECTKDGEDICGVVCKLVSYRKTVIVSKVYNLINKKETKEYISKWGNPQFGWDKDPEYVKYIFTQVVGKTNLWIEVGATDLYTDSKCTKKVEYNSTTYGQGTCMQGPPSNYGINSCDPVYRYVSGESAKNS